MYSAVSLVRWKTKLRILFSTFRESTAWKTRAVYAMQQLKTEYVLSCHDYNKWHQYMYMGLCLLSTEYTGCLRQWVVVCVYECIFRVSPGPVKIWQGSLCELLEQNPSVDWQSNAFLVIQPSGQLITSFKVVMFLSWFVCLSVNRITQKVVVVHWYCFFSYWLCSNIAESFCLPAFFCCR